MLGDERRGLILLSYFDADFYESVGAAALGHDAWTEVLHTGWIRAAAASPFDEEPRYRLLVPLRSFLQPRSTEISEIEWFAFKAAICACYAEKAVRWMESRLGDQAALCSGNLLREAPELYKVGMQNAGEAAAVCAYVAGYTYDRLARSSPSNEAFLAMQRAKILGVQPWSDLARVALAEGTSEVLDGASLHPVAHAEWMASRPEPARREWEDSCLQAAEHALWDTRSALGMTAWWSAFQRNAVERALEIERVLLADLRARQQWIAVARLLAWSAVIRLYSSRFEEARRRISEARTLGQNALGPLLLAVICGFESQIALAAGDDVRARRLAMEALPTLEAYPPRPALNAAHLVVAVTTWREHGAASALDCPWSEHDPLSLVVRAWLHDAMNRSEAALEHFLRAGALASPVQRPTIDAEFASWWLWRDQPERAAQLLRPLIAETRSRRPIAEALLAIAEARLGDAEAAKGHFSGAMTTAWDEYQRWAVGSLMSGALGAPAPTSPAPRPTSALLLTIADHDLADRVCPPPRPQHRPKPV